MKKRLKKITIDYSLYEEELQNAYSKGYNQGWYRSLSNIQEYLLGVPKEEVFEKEEWDFPLLLEVLSDLDELQKNYTRHS